MGRPSSSIVGLYCLVLAGSLLCRTWALRWVCLPLAFPLSIKQIASQITYHTSQAVSAVNPQVLHQVHIRASRTLSLVCQLHTTTCTASAAPISARSLRLFSQELCSQDAETIVSVCWLHGRNLSLSICHLCHLCDCGCCHERTWSACWCHLQTSIPAPPRIQSTSHLHICYWGSGPCLSESLASTLFV